MNDAEFSSLVEALTPRVVAACHQRMAGPGTSQFVNRPSTSSSSVIQPANTRAPSCNTSMASTGSGTSQFVNRPSTSSSSVIQPANTRAPSCNASMASTGFHDRPSTSQTVTRSTPREELRRTFTKRRAFKPFKRKDQASKSIDVILLPDHSWTTVVKGKKKAQLHQDGLVVDMFKFEKSWSEQQVFDALYDAFRGLLTAEDGEPITFCIKKAEGVDLVQPRISPNDTLNGTKVCEIFTKKTMYLSPDRRIQRSSETISSSDDSDCVVEVKKPKGCKGQQSGGGTPTEAEGVACPMCTYINPLSVTDCEMCFGAVTATQDSASTSAPCTNFLGMSADSSILQQGSRGSRGEGDEAPNPVETLRLLTGFSDNRPQILYLTRATLFEDNVAFFKHKFDVRNPISARFHGEQAIDAGGPLRENFRVLQGKVQTAELNMFYGTQSHNLLPSNNQNLLYAGMFEVLGRMISASIINGTPMRLPLHPAVVDTILDRPRDEQYAKMSLEDIVDVELKEFLLKILSCDHDDELTSIINDETNPTHWLDNCGWPVSKAMTVVCKHEIVVCVMAFYFIGMRSAAISAIQTGMKCGDRFPLKTIEPSQLTELLAPIPINAEELIRLVQPSVDRLKEDGSNAANMVVQLIEEINDSDANTLAVFATASDNLYPELTEIKLQLNSVNPSESSPVGNTCSNSILFPASYTDYSQFKSAVLKRMRDACNYFGMM